MSTSTGSKKDRFAGLGVQKNERPEEIPATTLIGVISTENNITTNAVNNETINTETNIKKSIQNPNVKDNNSIAVKSQKTKKMRNASFIIEQDLHRDLKRMSVDIDTTMVDILDEAIRIYMNVRNRKNLREEFENGKTVTDIIFEAIPE